MNTINFNIYGFAAPQSRDEYINLLDEAIRLGKELNEQISNISVEMQGKYCLTEAV